MKYKGVVEISFAAPLLTVCLGVLTAFVAAVPATASAADAGGYLGVGWGRFNQESDLTLTSSKDNDATRFFIGYQLNRFIGVEGGFANFNGQQFELGGGVTSRVDNDSFYARLNLQYPLWHSTGGNTVTVYVGGGGHQWDAKEVSQDAGGSITGQARARDTAVMYGAGVLVRGQRNSALRFDYEVYTDVGTANKIDLNLWSINIVMFF